MIPPKRLPRQPRYLPVLGALLFGSGLLLPGEAESSVWPARTGALAYGDFDGDGNIEVVATAPESICGEGVVYVADITAGSVTTWTRDTPGVLGTATCGDYFGTDVAVGNFNGDSYADLAVSAPGAGDSGTANSGAVHVLYGSPSGLTATGDQRFHQDSTGVSDTAETGDAFGGSLAAGDFNCDGYDDIAIGVPLESWTIQEAGGVHVLYGSASGVSTVQDWWRQGLPGVPGGNDNDDHFGASLAAGNFNGDASSGHACADLAIGIPDEDISGITDAGRVYVIYGATSGLSTSSDLALHQNKTGVEGDAESGDRFSARLSSRDSNGDSYDDLTVIVPGDADECSTGLGTGNHTFYGSNGGFSSSNNALSCEDYGCQELATDVYGCRSYSPPIWGTDANDTLDLFTGDDVAWGGPGADGLKGDHGNDILFGEDGDDNIYGGPGFDILLGGEGNDTFTIDADCEVVYGGVIDGGPGSDTIRSHLSLSELQSAGVTVTSIESFTVIPAQTSGSDHCRDVPFEEGPFTTPLVTLSWDDMPAPDSVFVTREGLLDLTLQNTGAAPLDIDLTFELLVRGQVVEQTDTASLAAHTSTTVTLDLSYFVPSGVDPQSFTHSLPTSATLTTWATLKSSAGDPRGVLYAPTTYAHVEQVPAGGEELVVYREQALRDTYNDGDLAHLGAQHTQSPSIRLQRTEATGSLGIPGY